MSGNKIIGLVGEMAAGKTAATMYLKQKYGAITFRFSDALRDVLKRLGVEETRANLQTLSTILRQNFGEDLLSKAMAAAAAASPAPLIIIEGVRRPSDLSYLKNLPGFKLIYLETEPPTRYERLIARRENPDDAKKTWAEFQRESEQESEQKIRELASAAHQIIDNNGSLTEFYRQLAATLKK